MLEPVPNVLLLDDITKDAIFKRWLEQFRSLTTVTEAGLADHIADTTDAHDASAISFSPTGSVGSTDVQAAIAEVDGDITAHIADTTAAHAATAIAFTPAGNISAITVQAAIEELDTEKQPLDSDLTAIAALTTTAYGRGLLELADETALEALLDTLPNLTSVQGFTVTLTDAGTDAILGWDDSANAYEILTASEVLEIVKTVDGSGSGLDADLLDGNSSAFFATASSVSDHLADTSDAHDASAISFSPAGSIAATDVQAAIQELDTEKQPLDADLTAIAALTTTAYGRGLLELADETALEALLDTLPNLTSVQGFAVTLSDAGADAVLGWDDSANAYENLTASEVLDIIKTVDGSGSGLAAETVTHADETSDTSCFITFSTAATGELGAKTNSNLLFNASTGVATFGQTIVGSVNGNAGTVTTANEATDTTCFVAFTTAASGSLPLKTNVNMTFNSSTGVVTFASSVLTTTDINGGTIDGAVIGGSSAAAITGTTITVNTSLLPDANDGAVLGASGNAFSDLFLASGAVIDFAAGNSVITHSSAVLTVSTGDLRVTTAGTNSASVVTVGGTQTLTAKTLTAPDINGGTADSLTSFSIRSTGAAFDLLQATSEAISANRTISWSVGNADRTITLSGNPTLSDWFDQSVKTTAAPQFATGVISTVIGAQAYGAITPSWQTNGTGQNDSQMGVSRWSTAGGGPRISGAKSSNAAGVGTHGAVSTGQDMFLLEAMGSDGSTFVATANLLFEAGSTISSGIVSGLWRTLTANSAGTLTEAMRIDDSQKVMFGFTTPITVGQSNKVQIGGSGSVNGGLGLSRFSADATGTKLEFSKSRNATIGNNTIAQSGDSLGEISWYGADGTNYDLAAQIIGQLAGTPTSNSTDMPGRLKFLTSPDGSATPLDRLWIEQNGDLQHYALFTSSTDYSRVAFKWATATLASVSGATVTATNLIPARANVIGVNTKVTVALGTGGGTTGYKVGDGTDDDIWGAVTGTATTTDTDGNDATANPAGTWATTARNVVITAVGGNFNGTGSIRVDVFFSITEAD